MNILQLIQQEEYNILRGEYDRLKNNQNNNNENYNRPKISWIKYINNEK